MKAFYTTCLLYTTCSLLACLLSIPAAFGQVSFTPRTVPQPTQPVSLPALIAAQALQIRLLSARIAGIQAAAPIPVTVFKQPFVNTSTRLFMLHTQSTCLGYGAVSFQTVQSVDGNRKYIQEAKRAGASGVGIDLASSTASDVASLANMYAAANAENAASGWTGNQTGTYTAKGVGKFVVYVKFDFSNTALENTQTIVSVLSPVLRDPANWVIAGRPVYSCYTGGGGRSWASLAAIFAPVNSQLTVNGVKPYFISGLEPTTQTGAYCPFTPAALGAWATGCIRPIADAVWLYPSGVTAVGSASGLPAQETLAQAAHTAGLAFQGAVMPQYGQINNPNTRYIENPSGGESLNAQMRSVNEVQHPELGVEGATGNDLGEMSQFLAGGPFMAGGLTPDPAQSVWVGYPHYDIPGFYPSKLGLQADLLYGLQRMATGQYPSITTDTLCAYYSRQTGAALSAPTADPRGGIGAENSDMGSGTPASLPDYVYVSCYLAQSGFVRLINAPTVPAQAHTNLVSWAADNFCVYDPVSPFTGAEVGQTLQIVQGNGWTVGNYTVDRLIVQTSQDGMQNILHLTAAPASGSIRLGQGTVYA